MKTQRFTFPWRKAGKSLNALQISMPGNNLGVLLNSRFAAVFLNLYNHLKFITRCPIRKWTHNSHLLYAKFTKYSPKNLWSIHSSRAPEDEAQVCETFPGKMPDS